ncbi:Serine/threonine-protein kinase AfsK [compost metagenome]
MTTLKQIVLGSAAVLSLAFSVTSCKKSYSVDGPETSPYVSSVYAVNSNRSVLALDPATGAKRWETKVGSDVYATPVVISRKLYVVDITGKIYRIDPKNGKIEASSSLGGAVYGTPLSYDRKLIIPIGNTVKMIDPTGNFTTVWSYTATDQVRTSPALNVSKTDTNKKVVFFAAGTKVYALQADNGAQMWQTSVSGAGNFASSVSAANRNYLYVGNDNGSLYALNSNDGSTYWSYPTGSAIKSSPISVGGNIIVGSDDRNLYSVDSATGLLRWKYTASDRIASSPFVYNQNVYFGSNDYNLYAINIIDGTLKWKFLTFSVISSSPFAYNNTLYFNSFDKNVYALDSEDGSQKWSYNTNATMNASMILDTISGSVVPSISGNYPY